jgi:DNA-binding NarL/FixJ family response regulator
MALRIGLFSEDTFVGEALAGTLLRDGDVQLACRVSRLRDLKSTLTKSAPDVFVLDTNLAARKTPIHPLAIVTNAAQASPTTHLVVMIASPSLALITSLLRAGVQGIVVKGEDGLPLLLRAISAAGEGIVFLCPRSRATVLAAKTPPKLPRGEVTLIRLLVRREKDPQFTRKHMAEELVIAEGTLTARIAQLREKLDAADEAEIVALARAWGLIE